MKMTKKTFVRVYIAIMTALGLFIISGLAGCTTVKSKDQTKVPCQDLIELSRYGRRLIRATEGVKFTYTDKKGCWYIDGEIFIGSDYANRSRYSLSSTIVHELQHCMDDRNGILMNNPYKSSTLQKYITSRIDDELRAIMAELQVYIESGYKTGIPQNFDLYKGDVEGYVFRLQKEYLFERITSSKNGKSYIENYKEQWIKAIKLIEGGMNNER
jgi:hypothetical protein